MNLITEATRERLLANHPEAAGEIGKLEGILDETGLSAELLALCFDYFDTTLRGGVWSRPESMSDLEAAVIYVYEQFMISVSGIQDEQIAALNAHLGADDVYNAMSSI